MTADSSLWPSYLLLKLIAACVLACYSAVGASNVHEWSYGSARMEIFMVTLSHRLIGMHFALIVL